MRYILLSFILILITNCSNETKKEKITEFNNSKQKKFSNKNEVKTEKIVLQNGNNKIELELKKNKLIYKNNRKIILAFLNNNSLSKEQLSYLKKSKKEYFVVKSEKLRDYFQIENFPSIVILDRNSSKIYNNIVPYELLKQN